VGGTHLDLLRISDFASVSCFLVSKVSLIA
jgi:hypothetical protein